MSQTVLHIATYRGDLQTVQKLLNSSCNLQAGNRQNDTPLHLAALRGHTSITKIFLEREAEIEARNKSGNTPLHMAASYGKTSTLDLLLDAGADLNAKNAVGNTPLHLAAERGHESVIEFLLRRGASMENGNEKQEIPLHLAVKSGFVATTEILISNGADLERKDNNQHTPLHLATIKGNIPLMNVLINAGGNMYNLNFSGNTGAHHAAYNGKYKIVELLLDAGFDINYQNSKLNTLLHHATYQGHAELANFLLKKGADFNIVNQQRETPLHCAILKSDIPIIEIFLEAGADMYNENNSGNTGAHHAAFNGNCEIINLLLDHGFNINQKNSKGNTLLHLASREGYINLVKDLTQRGANPSIFSSTGNSPATLAARLGYTNIVSILAAKGALLSNPNNGWSALHAAAFGNRLHTIQFIVTNFPDNIDLSTKWEELTAYNCANVNGNCDSAWWLRKQVKSNLQVETYPITCLEYCRKSYDENGSDIINRSRNLSKLQTSWIRKSIEDGQIEMHYMDEHGNTMLHEAVESGNADTVKTLVDFGALCVAQNYRNLTPLDISRERGGNILTPSDSESDSLSDYRVASHLYAVLMNIIAQSACLEVNNQGTSLDEAKNFDKEVQGIKLEAVHFVSNLLAKGAPQDPVGSCDRHLLHLAITNNNRTLLPILLAAGLPLTTTDSGLGLVQLAWLTPDITTWVGMVITRAVVHRLQFELRNVVDEKNEVEENDILRECIKTLIQDLNGEKPWEAEFKGPDDLSVTKLYVAACRYGATVTAWYIWKAGASNFLQVPPYNCTALEAALSEKHTVTGTRLILDMGANPFVKNQEDLIPMDMIPQNEYLLQIMLGRDFRSLDKMMVKTKDDAEKRDVQKLILFLIVLFIQYDSGKNADTWQFYLKLILKAYKQINIAETSSATSRWMVILAEDLVNKGVDDIMFKQAGQDVSKEISGLNEAGNLNNPLKKYDFSDVTDHFYSLVYTLHHNFFCLEIPRRYVNKSFSTEHYLVKKALRVSCEKQLPLLLHLLISVGKANVESILNPVCETRPLHHAAKNGNSSAISYLLRNKACAYVRDCSGILPIQYALMHGHQSVGDMLMEHMKNYTEKNYHPEMESCFSDHQEYLRLYGLEPEKNGKSRYIHVQTYKNLLTNRLERIQQKWRNTGMKEAVKDIIVDYENGEAKEVKISITKMLTCLKEKISQKNELFEGEIRFVGSSEDNVRLYCPDEYDCNLILKNLSALPGRELEATLIDTEKEIAVLSGHRQSLQVHPVKEEFKSLMKGSDFLKMFYDIVKDSLTEINSNWGNLKMMMPGIRRTQVGVALSFLWSGEKYPMLFIDIDFVPTVMAPWPENLQKPNCTLASECLEEVHLNYIGEHEWRLSFGLAETEIMRNLSDERRDVFLVCKMILATLKTESWVPHKLKCDFMYWDSRMFALPSKGGFALKNCFFQELEDSPNDQDWTDEKFLERVCSVFERMCIIGEPPLVGRNKKSKAPIEGTRPIKAYFGGDTEKPSCFLCAPEILKFLRSLDDAVV